MEILASLHFFHDLFPKKTDEELIKMIEEKNSKFLGRNKEILSILSELKKLNIIKW